MLAASLEKLMLTAYGRGALWNIVELWKVSKPEMRLWQLTCADCSLD